LQKGARVGAGPCERELELSREGALLALDGSEEVGLRFGEAVIRRADAPQRTAQEERGSRDKRACGQSARSHGKWPVVAQREGDPHPDGRARFDEGRACEHRRRRAVKRGCAQLEAKAYPAAANAAPCSVFADAKYAVSTGKAPHAAGNQSPPWKAPANSSRLYATTMKAPTAMKTSSQSVREMATAMPMPAA